MALVRRMTAATAAVTLACLFTEWLCYVLGRLYSSYVLSTKIGLHKIELIKGPFVNYVSIFLPIFNQVSTLSKHVY